MSAAPRDLTDRMFQLVGGVKQESPFPFLRWSIITAFGALIGRNAYIPFGGSPIYPNMYTFLVGPPGSRKGTGMSAVRHVLRKAGYTNWAPDKARKEATWARLAEFSAPKKAKEKQRKDAPAWDVSLEDLLGAIEDGTDVEYTTAQMFVLAPELIDFFGQDIELINNMTNLYDNQPHWDYPRTTKESLYIHEPTLSLLGGATPSSFMDIVPPSALGGGFMRRLLLIYAEQTRKVFRPPEYDAEAEEWLVSKAKRLMSLRNVRVDFTPEAEEALEEIYKRQHFLDDGRFAYYVGVRLMHLLKVCLVSAVARDSDMVGYADVQWAHTLLCRAELVMPRAIGHFGMSRSAPVAHVVAEAIAQAKSPPTAVQLYKMLQADVGSLEDLQKLLKNLREGGKIKAVALGGKQCYVPQAQVKDTLLHDAHFNQELLEKEERL